MAVIDMSPASPETRSDRAPSKFAYIDALRGYAVMLVITNHVGESLAELPYPLRRLTDFGWHGVQLFFLISCVTLMLSWKSDERKGVANPFDFWQRRFFRIAPMYYLAAGFYFLISPPIHGFDPVQLLTSVLFVNAWHPQLTPTNPAQWTVVPGGWSIGVEFTFYLLFPILVALIKNLQKAMIAFVVAVMIGSLANYVAWAMLEPGNGPIAVENFLYFWFPNQLSVFALGTVLYFLLEHFKKAPDSVVALFLRRNHLALAFGCCLCVVALVHFPWPNRLPPEAPFFVPRLLAASFVFMAFTCILALPTRSIFVNRAICSLGQVSFSAYLIHFSLIRKLPEYFPAVFDVKASGWEAIGVFFALWIVVVPLTYALSFMTFKAIEEPMIALGRSLQVHRQKLASTLTAENRY